jgi:glycerophosphoryl diester phosphodiesterase
MRIDAHRGVSAHYPENTLAAFNRAIELGVEGIELDVHLSRDGVPVVIHDETVDWTTNGIGVIADFTAKQLNLLDAGHRQHVPTLAQVLDLAVGKVRVNIEIKDPAVVVPVLGAVTDQPELDWFASSMEWRALAEMKRLAPTSDCYPLTFGHRLSAEGPGLLAEAIDFALMHGSTGVSVWDGCLDKEAVEAIHAKGLRAWAWTVNEEDRARELSAMGVDALCTDDPELIGSALAAATLGR